MSSLEAGFNDNGRGTVWSTATVIGGKIRAQAAATPNVSAAWPTNNQAYLIPFLVSGPVTIVELFFHAGTSPGTANYDLGIYNDAFKLLGSLGATASVNTTNAILPVGGGALTTPVTMSRGRYYLAMSAAATSITVLAAAPGNQVCRSLGMQQMASGHVLPATFTPASMGTANFIPMVCMSTIATNL